MDDVSVYAFTSEYSGIRRRLVNRVKIEWEGKEVEVNGQWDTGALFSCVSSDVVSALCLEPSGQREINTPSGKSFQNEYRVNISLPNNVNITGATVVDSHIGNIGIGILIGMDIITLGDFCVSNHDGNTVFSFRIPSVETTDYVEQIKERKEKQPTDSEAKK